VLEISENKMLAKDLDIYLFVCRIISLMRPTEKRSIKYRMGGAFLDGICRSPGFSIKMVLFVGSGGKAPTHMPTIFVEWRRCVSDGIL